MEKNPLITSLGNPLVKKVRTLRQRKGRVESGAFLVEGIHHVGMAMEAGWELETILYAPDLLVSAFARDLVEQSAAAGVRCQPVAPGVMAALSEKDHPQGLMAVARQRLAELGDLKQPDFRRAVALVAPQDPGNLGAILRSLDASGADGLILVDPQGATDPFHPSAVRASMGALFWKPVASAEWTDFLAWARAGGYRLIGTSAHAEHEARGLGDPGPAWVLVLGSEQKGLPPERLAACDTSIRLPMRGRTTSLNLAVAAGIFLYQLMQE